MEVNWAFEGAIEGICGVWSARKGVRWSGETTEQLLISYVQPRPYAAIDLIHQQPVRWTNERIVSCDGGGGPLGHPRIFINTDKPQICWCTYCGLPFVRQFQVNRLELLDSEMLDSQDVRLTCDRPTSTTAHTSSLCPQTSSHTRSVLRATPLRSTRHRRSQTSLSHNDRRHRKEVADLDGCIYTLRVRNEAPSSSQSS
jgi:uncharacterized Zn-finger protein